MARTYHRIFLFVDSLVDIHTYLANYVEKFLATKIKENFIISPLSAEIILSIIAEGARGDTFSELIRYLGTSSYNQCSIARIIKSLNQSTYDCWIVTASKVYISRAYEVNETFRNIAHRMYNTTVEVEDFKRAQEVSQLINKWVEDRSNNKILNLIHPHELNAATIILVNVIYFSATWAKPFRSKNTSTEKFYVSEGKFKEVLMMKMSRHSANFWHSEEEGVKFLELPFTNENITMTFILPDANSHLINMKGAIERYISHNNFAMRKVHIEIPKFSTEISLDLVPFLKGVGIKTLFSSSADLSGMSPKKGLSVSSVRQKVFINVTETGVEATSATYGIMNKMLQSVELPDETEEFIADHPFLFFLKEKENDVIIFIGQFLG